MQIHLRSLTGVDLPGVNHLERLAWPQDVQASTEKFLDRLETFGEGFLGAFLEDRLIGMASTQIIFYQNEVLVPWSILTADGWISKTHNPSGNCLHFVSICVHPETRHHGVATLLNRGRVALARKLGLEWALTDTRIPGLRRYLDIKFRSTPSGYIKEILAETVSEPVVKMYLNLGFKVLGLIPECMISDIESANYGLAMVKRINHDAKTQ